MENEFDKAKRLVGEMQALVEQIEELMRSARDRYVKVFLKDNAKALLHSVNATKL